MHRDRIKQHVTAARPTPTVPLAGAVTTFRMRVRCDRLRNRTQDSAWSEPGTEPQSLPRQTGDTK